MHRSLAINNRNTNTESIIRLIFSLLSVFFLAIFTMKYAHSLTHTYANMTDWLIGRRKRDWWGSLSMILWYPFINRYLYRQKEYELPPIDSLWVFFWVDLSRFLIVIQFCFVLLLFFSMLANLFSDIIDFWSSWRPAAVALDLVLNFFASCSLTRDRSFEFVRLFVSLPRNYCCYCSFLTIGWSALNRLQNYKAKLRL